MTARATSPDNTWPLEKLLPVVEKSTIFNKYEGSSAGVQNKTG